MKRLLPFLLAIPATLALAQSNHERRYELRPDPNWPLAIELSSGDYQIVPSESDSIAVVYQEDVPDQRKLEVQIASGHGENHLKIAGGKSRSHVVIEVPRRTDLHVRMVTGDLHIGEVEGNKDIEMRAGTLELNAIHPQDYAKADFSVRIGDLNVPGLNRNGFWRSLRTVGPGKYHLHAHVGVGDLTLRPNKI
ncbi:MAG TPA: hypothetical protein VE133_17520 [Candidatus Sulfotelmatobacter sp.]|nr:hypothetical protein [Candidatus Sulfotelmatobacter sp.]